MTALRCHNNTYSFCLCHRPPLFQCPEWITLIKTRPFNELPGQDAHELVPKYSLLYHHLCGDVGVFAVRRLLEQLDASPARASELFVSITSYRKLIALEQHGQPAGNLPGVWVAQEGSFDATQAIEATHGKVVIPQIINHQVPLGVALAYAASHALEDYLAGTQILLKDDILNPRQAIDFLEMSAHFIWGGFAGTLRLDHFLELADNLEKATLSILRSGYVSQKGWTDTYQERWIAFFLERLSSFWYLERLGSEELLAWQSPTTLLMDSRLTQGFNTNINLPHESPGSLSRGIDSGSW
ncbi:MAG: hypothetical protein ACKO0M_03880 [Cyanobium sp.]